jgi:hypothetical protein
MTEPNILPEMYTQPNEPRVTAVVVLMGKRNSARTVGIDRILFEYNNIPIPSIRSVSSPIDITDVHVISSIMSNTYKPDTQVEGVPLTNNLRNIYMGTKSFHVYTFYLPLHGSERITKVVYGQGAMLYYMTLHTNLGRSQLFGVACEVLYATEIKEFTFDSPRDGNGIVNILQQRTHKIRGGSIGGPITGFVLANRKFPIIYRDPWAGLDYNSRTRTISVCCFYFNTLCCMQTCTGDNPRLEPGSICNLMNKYCYFCRCGIKILLRPFFSGVVACLTDDFCLRCFNMGIMSPCKCWSCCLDPSLSGWFTGMQSRGFYHPGLIKNEQPRVYPTRDDPETWADGEYWGVTPKVYFTDGEDIGFYGSSSLGTRGVNTR